MSSATPQGNEQASGHPTTPFLYEIERAFYEYQVEHPYKLRLTADAALDVQKWLVHPRLKSHSKKESSNRGWALKNFRFDVDGQSGLFKSQFNTKTGQTRLLKC